MAKPDKANRPDQNMRLDQDAKPSTVRSEQHVRG